MSRSLNRNADYERDAETFSADAYTVDGWGQGVAFYVRGWELEADEDTEWSGIKNRTGQVVVTMVGDDRKFAVDPDDVHPINEDDYCHECGQVGCCHDGRDRSEA